MPRPFSIYTCAFALAVSLPIEVALGSGTFDFAGDAVEVNVVEGVDFELSVERSRDTRGEVSVDYVFVPLTAEAVQDYDPTGGTISFKDGEATRSIRVDLPQDTIPEHTETFRVVLSNPTGGAVLGIEAIALIRIRDNDWANEDTLHLVDFGCYDIPVAADPRNELSGPSPIPIVVSGINREVVGVRVKVSDLSHEGPGDLDLILEGPGGRFCKLMSDYGATEAGARQPADHLNLCFARDGIRLAPDDRLMTGSYAPVDHEAGDDFLLDRTDVGSGADDLGAFDGDEPNGTWNLHVVDDFQGTDGNPPHYTGKLLGGWELILTLEPVVPLPVITEVRDVSSVVVGVFFRGPADETFIYERSTDGVTWEYVRDITTTGGLQQLNSNKNVWPTAMYRFRRP